jgi:hypothetical protein
MKTIRRGVFETNSSTMHSLTIAFGTENEDLKKIIGSDILRFGVRKPEEIDEANEKTKKNWAIYIDKTYSWQDRADLLFWKLICMDYDVMEFLVTQSKIQDIFEKRGIKTEFIIKPNIDYILENCYVESDHVYRELFDYNSPDFESNIINYIFSPYIVEYSYDDDCINSKGIDELNRGFSELFNEFPENAVGFQKSYRE